MTCQAPDATREKIREYMARRKAGTLQLSVAGLHRLLAQKYGYGYSENTLYNHMRTCEGGL